MWKPSEDLHQNSGICSLLLKIFLQTFLNCLNSTRTIQVHGQMIFFTNLSTLSGLDPTMVSFIRTESQYNFSIDSSILECNLSSFLRVLIDQYQRLDWTYLKLSLGNRNMVYGANVGPQASRNYAKRIQEVYDKHYRYDFHHS